MTEPRVLSEAEVTYLLDSLREARHERDIARANYLYVERERDAARAVGLRLLDLVERDGFPLPDDEHMRWRRALGLAKPPEGP